METTLNEIVRDTIMVVLENEKIRLLTNEDIDKITKRIIDREEFNDIIIEEIKEYTENFK